jgi:hypothetical protein
MPAPSMHRDRRFIVVPQAKFTRFLQNRHPAFTEHSYFGGDAANLIRNFFNPTAIHEDELLKSAKNKNPQSCKIPRERLCTIAI